jgi:hypothetical protein
LTRYRQRLGAAPVCQPDPIQSLGGIT